MPECPSWRVHSWVFRELPDLVAVILKNHDLAGERKELERLVAEHLAATKVREERRTPR
jgi:hypothetical protein